MRVIFVAALLALGTCAAIGAWLVAAAVSDSRADWLAPLVAIDVAALLRFARVAPGPTRAMLAVAITTAALVIANWLVISLPMAEGMGMFPLDVASRTGPDFGWMLIRLGNTPMDWLWMAMALALAAWLGR